MQNDVFKRIVSTKYYECDIRSVKNIEEILKNAEEKIEKGIDPLNRGLLTTVPIDDSYPEYILNNQEKYIKVIKLWN